MSKPLTFHINAGNLWGLPEWSTVPRSGETLDYKAIAKAGFTGLQHYMPEPQALDAGLDMSGMARITLPDEAMAIARQHTEWGFTASTWHVGTGMESDAEMDALAGAVLEASASTGLPIHMETHRATMTQDMRRTLDLIERFPELSFNADLSHWYTGLEMRYGDWEDKIARLAPVFERVRYLHGRVGHSCAMQVPLDIARSGRAWDDFSLMWQKCFEGFAKNARPGEQLVFAPELLPASLEMGGAVHELNYALTLEGRGELSDRWEEALSLVEHAKTLSAAQ